MARYVELRRHTDNDGDALTEEGVGAALDVGRTLAGGYTLPVSTGVQRATHQLEARRSRFVQLDSEPGLRPSGGRRIQRADWAAFAAGCAQGNPDRGMTAGDPVCEGGETSKRWKGTS